ncbi:MAG: hypothetical protein ABIH99_00075, partial [Candidatus Micrarchaeota archaeon]
GNDTTADALKKIELENYATSNALLKIQKGGSMDIIKSPALFQFAFDGIALGDADYSTLSISVPSYDTFTISNATSGTDCGTTMSVSSPKLLLFQSGLSTPFALGSSGYTGNTFYYDIEGKGQIAAGTPTTTVLSTTGNRTWTPDPLSINGSAAAKPMTVTVAGIGAAGETLSGVATFAEGASSANVTSPANFTYITGVTQVGGASNQKFQIWGNPGALEIINATNTLDSFLGGANITTFTTSSLASPGYVNISLNTTDDLNVTLTVWGTNASNEEVAVNYTIYNSTAWVTSSTIFKTITKISNVSMNDTAVAATTVVNITSFQNQSAVYNIANFTTVDVNRVYYQPSGVTGCYYVLSNTVTFDPGDSSPQPITIAAGRAATHNVNVTIRENAGSSSSGGTAYDYLTLLLNNATGSTYAFASTTSANYSYATGEETNVTVDEGFITERGTQFVAVDSSIASLSVPKKVAEAQYYVKSTGAVTSGATTVTLAEGEQTSLTGGIVIKASSITETVGSCTASGTSGACTVDMTPVSATLSSGTASVKDATYYAVSDLVVLDKDSSAANVIAVGGPLVNTVTKQALGENALFSEAGTKVVQKFGNVIVVAGTTAADTTAAADEFVAELAKNQ